MGRPVAASQAWPQSSIWEALDLNNWKEDQKALGSSLPASGLLKVVRVQEKKWPLDTTLPQRHSLMASGGGWLNRTWYSRKSPCPEASASQRDRHCRENFSRNGLAAWPFQRAEEGLLACHPPHISGGGTRRLLGGGAGATP